MLQFIGEVLGSASALCLENILLKCFKRFFKRLFPFSFILPTAANENEKVGALDKFGVRRSSSTCQGGTVIGVRSFDDVNPTHESLLWIGFGTPGVRCAFKEEWGLMPDDRVTGWASVSENRSDVDVEREQAVGVRDCRIDIHGRFRDSCCEDSERTREMIRQWKGDRVATAEAVGAQRSCQLPSHWPTQNLSNQISRRQMPLYWKVENGPYCKVVWKCRHSRSTVGVTACRLLEGGKI
ncbi:hypothetical protein K438DRAFT_1750875 [Mycena galopus ATCC 62051]|nr:hypothetical protein K438DRAFT_1750875 [Mycena galopus ATCC 62051]